ncbi:MAG: hypothetical protein WDM70_07470 [Nitrosomonadales bacterium]
MPRQNKRGQLPDELHATDVVPGDIEILAIGSDVLTTQPEQPLKEPEQTAPNLDDLVFEVAPEDFSPAAMMERWSLRKYLQEQKKPTFLN